MHHDPLVGHEISLEREEEGAKSVDQDQFLPHYWAGGWGETYRVKKMGDWFNFFVNMTTGPSGKQMESPSMWKALRRMSPF